MCIIITQDAFSIADPSSMQDACYNEPSKYDLAHPKSPSSSMVRVSHAHTEGYGMDSPRGPSCIFFLQCL